MAGIEKICEYSGEYPGSRMYGYKRNHIQIMPKYRKLFRGADAVLHLYKPEDCLVYETGGYTAFNLDDYNRHKLQGWTDGLSFEQYIKREFPRTKHKFQWTYVLRVSNPELQGNVQGHYMQSTFDLKSTIKRLKRMLRCRNLKIVKRDCYYGYSGDDM